MIKRKRYPKPRHKKGVMNKTESRYADYLNALLKEGKIIAWKWEPLTFRLAHRTTYTPDFLVIWNEYVQIVEIKGFLREDANVKFKVAAENHPWFKWDMVSWKGGEWVTIKSM